MLSRAGLDRSQGELDSSKAAVFATAAKVNEAELNLGYATIRSPVTGLANRSLQEPGASVNAMAESAKLAYVAAMGPIEMTFRVPQHLVAKMRDETANRLLIGPKNRDYTVEVVLPDGTRHPHLGKINLPAPVVPPGNRLVHGTRGAARAEARALPEHVRYRVRVWRGPAGRDRRPPARRAAGIEWAHRLRGAGGRHRGGAAVHPDTDANAVPADR